MTCILNKEYVKTDEATEVFLAVDVSSSAPDLALQSGGNPVNICIALDTSGSMADEGKLDNAKQAAIELASSMRPVDYVSLITFSGDVKVQISSAPMVDHGHFEEIVRKLKPFGATNLHKALETAYSEINAQIQTVVQGSQDTPAVKRIILLTDGQPTKGKSKIDEYVPLSKSIGASRVSVVAIGLGSDYNEDLLSQIASDTDGVWYNIQDPNQLTSLFAEEFQEMKTVMMVKPELRLQLMAGAEVSEVYKVIPMLTKIEDTQREGNLHHISLSDVVSGKQQSLVFKIQVPARASGEFRIAKAELVSDDRVKSKDILVNFTDDSNLTSQEANPYPRVLLSTSESTVMLRQGISMGDQTTIGDAQTKLGGVMSGSDAATVVRSNPVLLDTVNAFNEAYQATVVKKALTEEEKKELKSKTTVIRKSS